MRHSIKAATPHALQCCQCGMFGVVQAFLGSRKNCKAHYEREELHIYWKAASRAASVTRSDELSSRTVR